MSIVMPDLSIGNFASVRRMVQKVGGTAVLAASPEELRAADKIILAGVGAFDNGMEAIERGGWADALHEAALVRRVPVLGICLGMQLMCNHSEEGRRPGLGWIDASVRRFVPQDDTLKVPHMGWNVVTITRENPLLSATGDEQRFYFVHSYYAVNERREDVIAIAHHGVSFTAMLGRDNLFGVQFHPEKSHRYGMSLMQRFVQL